MTKSGKAPLLSSSLAPHILAPSLETLPQEIRHNLTYHWPSPVKLSSKQIRSESYSPSSDGLNNSSGLSLKSPLHSGSIPLKKHDPLLFPKIVLSITPPLALFPGNSLNGFLSPLALS